MKANLHLRSRKLFQYRWAGRQLWCACWRCAIGMYSTIETRATLRWLCRCRAFAFTRIIVSHSWKKKSVLLFLVAVSVTDHHSYRWAAFRWIQNLLFRNQNKHLLWNVEKIVPLLFHFSIVPLCVGYLCLCCF